MNRGIIGFLMAVMLVVAPWAKSSTKVTNDELFQLYTGCKPLELEIAPLDEDALDIGLTENSVRTAVVSRL